MITNSLPGNSRVWVYQSTRELEETEAQQAVQLINSFADEWTSHKMEVAGSGHLLYNRFVVLMADEEAVKLGGCSIDSSVRFVKALEQKFGTSFFDRLHIAFKLGDKIQSCHQQEFEELIQKGIVNDDTIVFNNLVQTKDEFLTKWEIPYRNSWHKDLSIAHTSFKSVL